MLVKTGYTISASALITAWAKENPLVLKAEIKGKKAYISIRGVIWEYKNSSAWFEREIDQILSKGVKDVKVFINSPGGDVFQANDIANQIDRFKGKMEGEGGAIVASAATYIALRLKSFEMPENGQYMYHKPHGVFIGNEDKVKSDLKLLKNITSNYRKNYAQKTGLSEAEIESRWSKGDVWLSAQEAKDQKFITGVIKAVDISAQDSSMIAACGAPIKHKPTPNPPVTSQQQPVVKETEPIKSEIRKMDELKILALKLGLPENATQAEVDAKIQELQNKANKSDQAEEKAEQDAQAKKAADIKAFFEKSVKEKRLNAEQVKNMQTWAETDFDGLKKFVEGIEALERPTVKGGGDLNAKKKFEDYTEAELQAMEVEDPKTFNALYDAYLNQ